jgi:predicted polyphosphate/ATP-dependent NAD kinase
MVHEATVGVIANPASSRDVRRIVARGPAITTNDKINALARLLEGLAAVGVARVVSMSDAGGIAAGLGAIAGRASAAGWPELSFVDQEITHSPADTVTAARHMREYGVSALVVLGGDGTNRLLIGETEDIPVASISTGTNNAFPGRDEPTVVGLAAGLVATGQIDSAQCTYRAKSLSVTAGEDTMQALVDVAVVDGDRIASGAVWDARSLREVFLCFAEPDAVGLSSIGGRVHPVSRRDGHGLHVRIDSEADSRVTVPIAPGLVRDIGVGAVSTMEPGARIEVEASGGVIALDGERSMRFAPGTDISVSLGTNGPLVLDVRQAMSEAAKAQTLDNNSNFDNKGENAHD